MCFKDGNTYWIAQETRPFEIDSQRNMISHISTYSVIGLYKEHSSKELAAEIYGSTVILMGKDQVRHEKTELHF